VLASSMMRAAAVGRLGGRRAALTLPVVVLLGVSVPSGVVSAASVQLTVNTTADPAGPGCSGGVCSLRQALAAASGTTATITDPLGGTISLAQSLGELHVTGPSTVITVDSCAQPTTVDASGTGTRALEVDSGVSLSLDCVSVKGGHDSTGQGGGILTRGGLGLYGGSVTGNSTTSGSSAFDGGIAVLSPGTVQLIMATVTGNTASAPNLAQGGGIAATTAGSIGFGESTVAANAATATAAGGVAQGAGA
jgi:CSLREA domain-containing protein